MALSDDCENVQIFLYRKCQYCSGMMGCMKYDRVD